MNMLVNIDDKHVLIIYVKENKWKRTRTTQILGIVDFDEGLIKYLLKIFSMYELSKDNGYLKFENKDGEVYIILNSGYEVNHKSFNKWDNRLENLEMIPLELLSTTLRLS